MPLTASDDERCRPARVDHRRRAVGPHDGRISGQVVDDDVLDVVPDDHPALLVLAIEGRHDDDRPWVPGDDSLDRASE
jgi:hypothetical protein